MRQAQGGVLLKSSDGVAYAVHLKADFVAEHEQGIGGLHHWIGAVDESIDGIGRYSMKKDDRTLSRAEKLTSLFTKTIRITLPDGKPLSRKLVGLRFGSEDEAGKPSSWLIRSPDVELSGAWDNRSFEIIGYTPEATQFIMELHSAILSGDFSLHIGRTGNPFDNGGLNISIASRIPEEQLLAVKEAHEGRRRLEDAAKATGIEDRVRARSQEVRGNEFNYFALSPRWRGTDETSVSEHPVKFWLNPIGRQAKSGWYTVEELDAWLEGHGPVVGSAMPQAFTLR